MALSTKETNAATAFMSLPGEQNETTRFLPLGQLHEYQRHPFKVRMNEDMAALVESVRENGIIEPILVRRDPKRGGFEIIAGHRRRKASELAGLDAIPCIVRDIDDDTADILMADSNLKREEIAISEKAWAYRIKLEAMKRRAGRPQKNASQIETHFSGNRSDTILAAELGESRAKIQRYIRLTYLIPELLEIVDAEDMPIGAGVAISYLTEDQQQFVHTELVQLKHKLTLAQAEMIKEVAQTADASLIESDVHHILVWSELPPRPRPISSVASTVDVRHSSGGDFQFSRSDRTNEGQQTESALPTAECLCVSCTCTGCHEECYGHCHGCGDKTEDCNSYQAEGEKRLPMAAERTVDSSKENAQVTVRHKLRIARNAVLDALSYAEAAGASEVILDELHTIHTALVGVLEEI